MEKVAICITTHNRKEVFEASLAAWNKYSPKNAKIFVVDDCSIVPVESDYRFDIQAGIAKAKNKCLELAKDYDHIFLVDDDIRPIKEGWEKIYTETGINHLSLTFDKNKRGFHPSRSVRKLRDVGNISYYSAPNGCMLYLRKECLKVAGGMRPEFGLWGFEHVEYSDRIFLLGLTDFPFMDVKNSLDFFEVLDWSESVISSLSYEQRKKSGKENLAVYEKFASIPEFVDFH
jgi:glycosyltransferase involved in cell wall biosynthesis